MTKLNPEKWNLRPHGRLKALCQPPLDHDIAKWLRTVEHDLVSRRAREIYFERGALPGWDLDNWLLAEAEIRNLLEDAERALHAVSARNQQNPHSQN